MLKKQVVVTLVVFLALVFDASLYARGLVWNFLGDTHIDGAQDHDRIQVGLRHGPFRAVLLRVSDAIFIQRVVVYYVNGTSEELVIGDRVSPEGRTHVIDLTGEDRALESVELWYFKEHWEHRPRVILYGTRRSVAAPYPSGAQFWSDHGRLGNSLR
jgi:hypothetical protein